MPEDQTHEADVHVLDVAHNRAELALVRRWVRMVLQNAPAAVVTDVVIVLDELVSNALRHGLPPHQVRLLRHADRLRIEVDDSCPEQAFPRTPSEAGGRGLALVASCAVVWGQQQHDAGKTVWAELTAR